MDASLVKQTNRKIIIEKKEEESNSFVSLSSSSSFSSEDEEEIDKDIERSDGPLYEMLSLINQFPIK